jgi:Arc/MetJ family transcription regulator
MRTNIDIDDKLMADAQRLTGLPTKKAVVEEALKLLVQLRNQARIRELRGKVRWEGDLDAWRRDDDDEAA